MNKAEFLAVLRDLVGEGRTEDALDFLHDHIKDIAAYFINDVVMLKNQFVSAKNQFTVKGIIENSEFGRISARVNLAILELADKIEKKSETNEVQRKGHLLHRIPSTMVIDREVKCIVRIAYFPEHLLIGLTIDDDITVQVVQITKLMSVELLDDNETKIFEIRTSTDEEQFTIYEECTQWIFHVRPIRIGNYPLLLKIDAVEVINGKERKRNIIIEKEIQITIESSNVEETKFSIIHLNDDLYFSVNYFISTSKRSLVLKHLDVNKLEKYTEERKTREIKEAKRIKLEKEMRKEMDSSVYSRTKKYRPPITGLPENIDKIKIKRSRPFHLAILIAIILIIILILIFLLKK